MTKSRETKSEKFVNKSLRHAEYYDMQKTFDDLYAKSEQRETFEDIMGIILSRENILLAYRNIKGNKGSHTKGTDGLTIKDIEALNTEETINTVRELITRRQGYQPKPVRRKDIPKPNGSKRPLGIPCIWDRLIQQCIKQVMEPICEAKFCEHSYGFRPGRSVEHAMAEVNRYLNKSKCHFVVEVDIKGFFDNVNHSKLLKQIWAMGIHDKHLLYVIRKMLKAPIRMPNGTIAHPTKGTPQGGIISPLLANIVLNELDWWIVSQWENNPVTEKYTPQYNKNGSPIKSSGYAAMRKTNLKEMHIVRYADDFRIFCKTKNEAERVKLAVTKWLKERLKLDISPEKTRVVNTKRKYSEFLGFKVKVVPKGTKQVTKSHICDKKRKQITKELKDQIKKIQRPNNSKEALKETIRYNSKVMGIHNYFQIASHVNLDCGKIARQVNTTMINRLNRGRSKRLTRTGRPLTRYERMRYGKSKMMRYDASTGSPIYPIKYVQTRNPMHARYKQTPYTQNGRARMHRELGINTKLLKALMKTHVNGSIEYADNRISLFSGQYGKCAITGTPFKDVSEIHCHHKIPRKAGGSDKYENLILVHKTVHKLIHAKKKETIQRHMNSLNLTPEQIDKVNHLRKLAEIKLINTQDA